MLETNLLRAVMKSGRDTGERKPGTINDVWENMIEGLVDPASDMTEDEKKEYERKIEQKMKMGKRLTSEELNFLRVYNPELYKSAMRVEILRKSLQNRLKSCRSKDEVNSVIMSQMGTIRSMKKDPDREYIAAMVREVVQKFKESGAFARLPEKTPIKEKTRKASEKTSEEIWKDDGSEEENVFQMAAFFSSLQLDCNQISRMTELMLGV